MNAPARSASEADGHAAEWTVQRERSNLWVLRLMRWIALTAGRRATRPLLHPITLYYMIANPTARRESARYLGRVWGRPARLLETYRHIHTFAATVLDRVYLLQEECGALDLSSTGGEVMEAPLAAGRGTVMVGAHFGSFEALRAFGKQQGVKVAMLMYEDNARLINTTLAAIAPQARLNTIALGRVDAMLQLRDWLNGGGLAGMLADRTLAHPGTGRSRTHWLDFLGAPAAFSDGPFRLAAMLRRPMVFMAGIYHGGKHYELRFEMLVEFGSLQPGSTADVDAQIQQAMQRYVAIVESLCREAPCNWFNFYDFWAEHADAPAPPRA